MHAHEDHRSEASNLRVPVRRPAGGAAPLPGILGLQQAAGNLAVTRMLHQGAHPSVQRTVTETGSEPSGERRSGDAPEGNPQVLVQPHYASGDQFAIAATLMHDTSKHIYISYTSDEDKKKAAGLQDFYHQSNIDPKRVHLVLQSGIATKYGEQFGRQPSESDFEHPTNATEYVAANFGDEMRGDTRKGWGLEEKRDQAHGRDEAVAEWLEKKGVRPEGQKIAILWSRFSGKNNEVHIEHDSSYFGIGQILAGLNGIDTAMIVGDAKPKRKVQEKPGGKYAAMTRSFGPEVDEGKPEQPKYPTGFDFRTVDLTEFWKGSDVKSWGGDSRTGQFLVFDYLHRHATVRHLGFRSGNLEAMALLGFNVMYMEEPGSDGGNRMAKWHDRGDGKTESGGEAPGYERLVVKAPPTRSGKFQKSLTGREKRDNKHAEWREGEEGYSHLKREGRDPDSKSLPRGFEPEDLGNIDAYLHSGNAAEGLEAELVDGVKEIMEKITGAEKKLPAARREIERAQKSRRENAHRGAKAEAALAEKVRQAEVREEELGGQIEEQVKHFRDLAEQFGRTKALRARILYAQPVADRLVL
ncbi:hypothetical protein C5F59_004845 [Streptomyces sp. QL37]|uniref:hypothetical protein n=1 Tax=Streptomyces sp. QL37 TaxID=2093747 RepID=UPI000CF20E13|nr:hypothetical protein [Streptomyces sp. QL37]PPQ56100.1 hypothetical protein C5F59_04895 [Streptomyces sp. QL37]